MQESIGKAYKPWLVASLTVLVLSLILLAVSVVAAFSAFGQGTPPVWVVALGGVAVFGMLLGFGGMVVLMSVAGWRSFREERKVQVIPPEHKT